MQYVIIFLLLQFLFLNLTYSNDDLSGYQKEVDDGKVWKGLKLDTNRRYINSLEVGQVVSLFSNPGYNWKSCSENSSLCKPTAWPHRDSDVWLVKGLPERIVEEIDPVSGEKIKVSYTAIYTEYKVTLDSGSEVFQKKFGWINSAYLEKKKYDPFYMPKPIAKPGTRDCLSKPADSSKQLDKAAKAALKHENHIVDLAENLRSHVGQCSFNPKTHNEFNQNQETPYDTYVLPKFKDKKNGINVNKQNITQAQLIEIDSLARTLYAEMGICYKHGLQYPMAVAAVALNRVRDIESDSSKAQLYIKGPHNALKTNLSKIVTSSSQFHVWKTKHKRKDGSIVDNGSLKQALCPPVSKDKNFYTGNKPGSDEVDIWTNTLRIATEAVLYPKEFRERTNEITVSHFSSESGFFNYKEVTASIEGRSLSNKQCLRLWRPPTEKK